MEKSNLLTDSMRKLDEARIEARNTAFGQIFEKTTKRNKVISLGDSFKVFAMAVGFAIQSKAKLADKFLRNVGRFKVGEVFIAGLVAVGFLRNTCSCSTKAGVFLEDS